MYIWPRSRKNLSLLRCVLGSTSDPTDDLNLIQAIDLHRSKPLISLVPITCTTYCFQGQGHCYVTIPIHVVYLANHKPCLEQVQVGSTQEKFDVWPRPKSKKRIQFEFNIICLLLGFTIDYEQSPIFPQGQQSERNASARENHPTREQATRGGEREK